MKVIFLDFDGVINNWYNMSPGSVCYENVVNLKKIIDITQAFVVVTSSNKYSFQRDINRDFKQTIYYEYLCKLRDMGVFIFDVTPMCLNRHDSRTCEIKMYLSEHPEITSYVILDDELVGEDLRSHQVLLDNYMGLLRKHVEPALNILNYNLGFYPTDYNFLETPKEKNERINDYYLKRVNK